MENTTAGNGASVRVRDPSLQSTSFWRLLREDFSTHGRDLSAPGFRAMMAYRLGSERKRHPLLQRKLMGFAYKVLQRYIRNNHGIELYDTTTIGRRTKIAHQGAIVIHENAVIGDDCVIRQAVTIGAVNDMSAEHAPRLGNRVHIGAGAVIIGRINIGDDVRIGPNAVVTTNIPPGRTVVSPAPRVLDLGGPQPDRKAHRLARKDAP